MKASLLLADAATAHPDGTFSLLRGGITQLHAPAGKPLLFRGALVVRLEADPAEHGPHEFKIACITAGGAPVEPEISAAFDVPPPGGAVNIVLNLSLQYPKPGRYEFSLVVDRSALATWPLEIAMARAPVTQGR